MTLSPYSLRFMSSRYASSGSVGCCSIWNYRAHAPNFHSHLSLLARRAWKTLAALGRWCRVRVDALVALSPNPVMQFFCHYGRKSFVTFQETL